MKSWINDSNFRFVWLIIHWRPLLIGVTILTSLSEEEIHEIGYAGTPEENVLRLAKLAESSGLDGIVCSPLEAAPVRKVVDDNFQLVTLKKSVWVFGFNL